MSKFKILSNEYGSFRTEIQEFFKRRLKKPSVILDPMAGTAPLIPFFETHGHTAYLNDIMPIHFFINKAKTYEVFQHYHRQGFNWYVEQLLHCMNSLEKKVSIISDKWIDDSILSGLIQAWHAAEKYDENSATLLKATILLCVRPYSSITKSKNPTWLKYGGISSNKDLKEIIIDSLTRYDQYYKHYYGSAHITKKGECIFTTLDAVELDLPQKVDFILTSPWYCNRIDPIVLYGPENHFLSALGYTFPEHNLVSTPKVRDYNELASDFERLTARSKYAQDFLTKIKDSNIPDDPGYYLKYYTRYFATLYKVMDMVSSHLSTKGKMYIILQDNIHRGELIEIDRVLSELFKVNRWKSRVVKTWERPHHGLRNISRNHAFVKPKHFEKILLLRR